MAMGIMSLTTTSHMKHFCNTFLILEDMFSRYIMYSDVTYFIPKPCYTELPDTEVLNCIYISVVCC